MAQDQEKEPEIEKTGDGSAPKDASKPKLKPRTRKKVPAKRKRAVAKKTRASKKKATDSASKPRAKTPQRASPPKKTVVAPIEPVTQEAKPATQEAKPATQEAKPTAPIKTASPKSEAPSDSSRSRGSSLFGGFARRLVSQGVEALGISEEVARNLIQDNVPIEAVTGILETAAKSREEVIRIKDEVQKVTTKGKEEATRLRGDVQKVVSREVRRQIERIDFRDEISKVLSDYALEITARIHFVPLEDEDEEEESPEEGEGILKRRKKKKKKRKDDVQINFVRKLDPMGTLEDDEEDLEPLSPADYFDDDDDFED